MMKKKGVSEIIATILIILLVLAAIIIVWQVVSNVIKGGATTVEERSKCIDVSLEFQEGSVVCRNAAGAGTGNANNLSAIIKRGGDSAGQTKMRVVAKTNISDYIAPTSLGTSSVFLVNVGSTNGEKIFVKVAPIVGANFDVICDPSDEFEVTCS